MNLNGGNVITGASQQGIQALAGAQPVSVSGSQNQFYGNGTGANNPATPPLVNLDLPCNWWGSATGPAYANNPLGTGNSVTDGVNYINWAIDNSTFSCVGNPARNEEPPPPPPPPPPGPPPVAAPVAVPVNQLWALLGSALALAGFGAAGLSRSGQRQRRQDKRGN